MTPQQPERLSPEREQEIRSSERKAMLYVVLPTKSKDGTNLVMNGQLDHTWIGTFLVSAYDPEAAVEAFFVSDPSARQWDYGWSAFLLSEQP